MNRDAGLCRQICAFRRSTSARGSSFLVHQRAQHGEEQRHQQRRRAALARHVPHREDDPAVVERQHVVEVAADGVGRPREAADFVVPTW
jgi:hypothetical protein